MVQKKYLVLTSGTVVDDSKTIPVPTNNVLLIMDLIYQENENNALILNEQIEKGVAVKTDGYPTQVVSGSENTISEEQWRPAMLEIGDRANVDYLVHLHPINLRKPTTGAGDKNPSEIDCETKNFFNSNVNIILYFEEKKCFTCYGASTNIRDYEQKVSFYNQTSSEPIHMMSFKSYQSLVRKINAL